MSKATELIPKSCSKYKTYIKTWKEYFQGGKQTFYPMLLASVAKRNLTHNHWKKINSVEERQEYMPVWSE